MLFCHAYNLISIEYKKSFVKVCLFWEKTTVFQLEILINHHGNHFHGFMALVEEKNQNPFTKLHTLVSTIKWQSIIQN